MEANCHVYVRRSHKCRIYAKLQHQPLSVLSTLTLLWPFLVWGINIIEKLKSKGTGNHEYVLIVIDYFIKWVEATFYAN